MPTFFAPRPGRLGVHPVIHNSGRINTGTVAAGTQNHNIGTYPGRAYVNRFTVTAEAYPNATTNTITLVKYDASASADVVLSSVLDINNKTANVAQLGAILTTLTEAQRILDPGDTLRIQFITTGTVTTQPDDITINVELLVLE